MAWLQSSQAMVLVSGHIWLVPLLLTVHQRFSSLDAERSRSKESPRRSTQTTLDVTSKDSLQQCIDVVKSHSSHVDVLVANAGITGPVVPVADENKNVLDIDTLISNMWKPEVSEIHSIYHVNMTAVHFTIAAFLPMLHEANRCRPKPETADSKPHPQIITTASISAFNRRPMENLSYGPLKAGVVYMMKSLSSVLVPYAIRVNTIAPGFYPSGLTEDIFKAQGTDAPDVEGAWTRNVIPARRSGNEEDIEGVTLFLCSRAGAYINGLVLITDRGRLSVMSSSY